MACPRNLTSTSATIAIVLWIGCFGIQADDDVTAYESGGAHIVARSTDIRAREQQEVSIRDFIWTHWNDHRLGRIAVTWINIHAEAHSYFFVIEPDSEGRWCISVQVARTLYGRGPVQSRRYESDKYVVSRLERKQIDASPSRYRLLLMDERSKVRLEI